MRKTTAEVSVVIQKPEQEVLENASSRRPLGEASAGCVVKPDGSPRMRGFGAVPQ